MKNKLGIIVPYRDRYEHLQKFLPHMESYLSNKGIEYTIIVVEQDNASAFNRGMLCNIGFLEAKKQRCNYVVFHDVDMLPVDVDYSYSDYPVHLISENIPFPSYFGGITLFPSKDFEKINGYSNVYWGWGFEDDDLRYRCAKHGLSFYSYPQQETTETAIFNGVSAYVKIPNVIDYSKDFYIHLNFYLDKPSYNLDKQVDIYPIVCIPGYDLQLSFNSFHRFTLQAFDNSQNYFELASEVSNYSNNIVEIEYIKIVNRIKLTVNSKKVGYINLSSNIYDYKDQEFILFGTDSKKENFFKGALEDFHIEQEGELLLSYIPFSLEEYKFNDLSKNNNHGELKDVYLDKFTTPVTYYHYIPHRRETKIDFLPHITNGYLNGRWKSDLTRWNQLRYNNEVQSGGRDNIEDGLSNCKYTLHGKIRKEKYIHLNVGI